MIVYSLWARTFLKADQDHLASTGQQAWKALSEELEDEYKKSEDDDEEESEDDDEEGDVNAICLSCKENGRRDKHWISECRRIFSNSQSELTNLSFCIQCLYLKKNNKEHRCKACFSRKLFCRKCSAHVKLCKRPKSHRADVLPEGAQLAEKNEEKNEEDDEDEGEDESDEDKQENRMKTTINNQKQVKQLKLKQT